MKVLVFVAALVLSAAAHAAPMTFDISCVVEQTKTAPNEVLRTTSVEVFKNLQNQSGAVRDYTNIGFEVGVGNNITTEEGEHGTLFYVVISDLRTHKQISGEYGISPFTHAQTAYEATDIHEAMSVDCQLAPSQL
jgi:hypothetical protein